MEQGTASPGEGGVPDLSALLNTLTSGQGKEGGPDLSSLLGMLGLGGQESPPPSAPAGGDAPGQSSPGGLDFASLLGVLGGLGGGEEKASPPPQKEPQNPGFSFDPALLSTLSRAMAALREPDRNIQLLQALRPFLEEERQRKVDEAVKLLHLMRLAPLLQESGILNRLTGGE